MTRPAHFDDYSNMTEVVPGVFLLGCDVYIVDDEGEVCCWVSTEYAEDPSAIEAALNAVILATKRGAAAVRENIARKGEVLEGLIQQTFDTMSEDEDAARSATQEEEREWQERLRRRNLAGDE